MTERTEFVQGSRECDQYYRRRHLHCSLELQWVGEGKGKRKRWKLQDNKIEKYQIIVCECWIFMNGK